MTTAGLVVVGAGLAGLRAVEAARRTGYTGTITLVGDESEDPYDRPPLSKAFLTGAAAVRRLRTTESLQDELDVTVRLGATVTALHPADRLVVVDGGELAYAGLVLATGSTARSLDLPHLAGVHTLRSHADALALREAITPGSRVVVVGAGFIGSEVACSATEMGAEVTVLEAAHVPLVRAVGEQMGAALLNVHRRHGVAVRCGTAVEAFVGADRVRAVRLTDGEEVPADVVVVGVGAAPATAWLTGSGLALDDGVVCDSTLAAGPPGVYAAGDIARWHNPLFDRSMRLEHWTAAAEQGGIAGRNAAAPEGAVACEIVPYFWSDWAGDWIQLVGVPDADETVVVAGDPAVGDFLTLYRTGDRVTGALGVNQRRAVTRVRGLIAARGRWAEGVEAARAATSPAS